MSGRLRRWAGCSLGLPCGCALLLIGCLFALPLLLLTGGGGSGSADGGSGVALAGSAPGTSDSGGEVGVPVRIDLRALFPWSPLPTGSWPSGQCTWFVVYQGHAGGGHRVMWSGNAYEWYGNAAAAGVPTEPPGVAPQPGWIAVYAPGHGSDPHVGHVAVVVGVQANAGTYTVAEMNLLDSGVADIRTLPLGGDRPLLEGWIP